MASWKSEYASREVSSPSLPHVQGIAAQVHAVTQPGMTDNVGGTYGVPGAAVA